MALNLFCSRSVGEGKLFNLDLCTSLFEGCFELLSLCLRNFLLHRGGSTVNQILGLFQTKTKGLFGGLDNLELSGTGADEDYVKLGLLSGGCGGFASGSGHCDSGGCGLDTILFLKDLSKFLNVFYRKVYQLFCKGFNICHNYFIF